MWPVASGSNSPPIGGEPGSRPLGVGGDEEELAGGDGLQAPHEYFKPHSLCVSACGGRLHQLSYVLFTCQMNVVL